MRDWVLGFGISYQVMDLSPAQQFKLLSNKRKHEWISEYARRTGQTEQNIKVWLRYAWYDFWARAKQRPPQGKWLWWSILAGRGFGKTRTGAQWIIYRAKRGLGPIGIVAETAADARDVLVDGPGGILQNSPPWFRPKYNPSMRRLTWPNNVTATLYSGDEPDQLRGPQFQTVWIDELAKYRYPGWAKKQKRGSRGEHGGVMDNLEFGIRIGDCRGIITTTPRPIPAIKALLCDTDAVVVRGSLLENEDNLARTFVKRVKRKYEGSRLGRQEINGEVLDDNPNALWNRNDIELNRELKVPNLYRIVVAIDPSGSSNGNECGIITGGIRNVCGVDHLYVLEDSSIKGSPEVWANSAIMAYHKWKADLILAEANYGGEMVKTTLKAVQKEELPFKMVYASRGKYIRAEPVSVLYEQQRAHHIGYFSQLEDELCEWEPGMNSPNRLDALVWLGTELIIGGDKVAGAW